MKQPALFDAPIQPGRSYTQLNRVTRKPMWRVTVLEVRDDGTAVVTTRRWSWRSRTVIPLSCLTN